jgi:probable HAF family extracellular repeat protein
MVDLGVLNGFVSLAHAVSSDGNVVVGDTDDTDGVRAFRWTQAGGMVSLGMLNNGGGSVAFGVNSDGSVVVGQASDGAAGFIGRAFRWTQAGGMVSLGSLNGGPSSARGVSSDGSVVVGAAQDPAANQNARAFRWTQATGLVSLGVLNGGIATAANAVNSDGSVVVGTADLAANVSRAFRWTAVNGMQSVEDWLRASGVTVLADVTREAKAVNADGSVVVGTLTNGLAFIARVSGFGSGLTQTEQLLTSLAGNAITAPQAGSLGSMVLHGAHSRPLEHRAEPGKSCVWAAGDVGRDDHGERDGKFALVELGGCHAITRNLHGSLALGRTTSRQRLPVDGESTVQATYGMVELLGNVPGTKLWPSAALLYQRGEADVNRGYTNAGLPDYSRGRPDVQTTAVRLRVDWEDAMSMRQASFTPYADLSYATTKIDAYTETGGGFPARFEERTEDTTEARLGIGAAYPWSSRVKLLGQLEAAHRFENTGASTSGSVLGLFTFELPGEQLKRDWLRAGLGVAAQIGPGLLTAMANGTTQGAVPSWWFNVSYQVGF